MPAQSSGAPGFLGRVGQGLRDIGRCFHRFGFGAGNRLVPLFQNITEKFVYGFLALDLVALISPRVVTSLLVGRDEYHPQEHPEVRNQPFPKQIASWIHGTIRGLNWGNCDEEMRSEFVTGAGIIATPAVLYAFARRMSGRSGNDLGFKSIRDLSEGWMSRLQGDPKTHDMAGYKRLLTHYLESTFADLQMKQMPMEDPAIRESLVKTGIANPTYGDYLNNRLHQWVDIVFNHNNPAECRNTLKPRSLFQRCLSFFQNDALTERRKALEPLIKEMEETLGAFNRKHRLMAYDYTHERLSKPIRVEDALLRADRIWTLPGAAGEPTRQPIGGYLEKLRLWSDYACEVWQHAAGPTDPVASGTLRNTARGLMEKIIARKGMMAVLSVVLTGLYCSGIAFWARHHASYPATRKYQAQNLPTMTPVQSAQPSVSIAPPSPSSPVRPFTASRPLSQPEGPLVFAPSPLSFSPPDWPALPSRAPLSDPLLSTFSPAVPSWMSPPVGAFPLMPRPGDCYYRPYFSGQSGAAADRRAE